MSLSGRHPLPRSGGSQVAGQIEAVTGLDIPRYVPAAESSDSRFLRLRAALCCARWMATPTPTRITVPNSTAAISDARLENIFSTLSQCPRRARYRAALDIRRFLRGVFPGGSRAVYFASALTYISCGASSKYRNSAGHNQPSASKSGE